MAEKIYTEVEIVSGVYISGICSVNFSSDKTYIDIPRYIDSVETLDMYVELLQSHRSNGKKVVVRSVQGKSKAPIVVSGYMCRYLNYDPEDALREIERVREIDINLVDYLILSDYGDAIPV